VGVNRRYFSVVLISGLLFAAAVLFPFTFPRPSASVDSFSGEIRSFYVGRNETGDSRPRYVPGEVVVKFKREAVSEEIAALRIGRARMFLSKSFSS
jgi:hypothetical protein